ncbi:MAG: hypothetical protein EKK33_19110 [Bradyrhizobiaceae bacterium]|nr:MAG: hypothetical protein EKK33_19110 [Bradyrhizobiaceae bacterium]
MEEEVGPTLIFSKKLRRLRSLFLVEEIVMWWRAFRSAPADVCNRAMREVFTVGFVSLLPLLLGILIANIAYFKTHPFSLSDSLGLFAGFLLSGQLFFFAMSFAGSIIFVASDDYNQGNFPPRLWFFLVAVVCSAFSFAFIGLDPKLDSLNNPVVFVVSFLTYAISAYAFYVLLVLTSISPPTAEDTNRQAVRDLTGRVLAIREGRDD